jgi:hypothetical protein
MSESVSRGCGSRATYKRGCRCLPCRAAHAAYHRARRRAIPFELVSAAAAMAHLAHLAGLGVGYRQAARLSGVSTWEIKRVRTGRLHAIRPETEARILAIRPLLAHGQRVSAWPTWRLIHSLEREGFTLGSLARRLGLQTPQLQFDHGRVTVKNALLVRQFHTAVTAEGPEVTA